MKKRNVIFCTICMIFASSLIVVAAKPNENSFYSIQSVAEVGDTNFKYKRTIYNVDDSTAGEIMEYTDENNNEFFYNIEGQMVGFIKSEEELKTASSFARTISDYKNTVESMVGDLVDIENYSLVEDTYAEVLGIRYLTYYRFVNGYKTSDFVSVSLNSGGEIVSYAAPNVGKFKDVTISNISEDVIDNHLIMLLDTKFGEKNYEYYKEDTIIDIVDGDIISIVFAIVTLDDGTIIADNYKVKISE